MTKILSLNGWAQPSDGLLPVLPEGAEALDYTQAPDLESLWTTMRALQPETLVGWSLGGQLCVRAILDGGVYPQRLILLGAPWRFVANADYPEGMGATTYEMFVASYAKDPKRTAKHFATLVARGDIHAARIQAEEAPLLPLMADGARWLRWQETLRDWQPDLSSLSLVPPTLVVHGAEDGIISPAQAHRWHTFLPECELQIWEGCGHGPHLHDAEKLRTTIATWLAKHA